MRQSTIRALSIVVGVWSLCTAESILGIRSPLGLPLQVNSGTSLSMGGAGVGVDNDNNLYIQNPANLGNVRKTVLSSLFLIDITDISDGNGRSRFARFTPRQFSFGFPAGVAGAIAVGYEQRRDARSRYEFETIELGDDFTDISNFQQTYTRDGGESAWQVAWGRSIGRWARIGLAYERVYARTSEARTIIQNAAFSYAYTDSVVVTYRGNGLRGGVQIPLWHFTFGAAAQYYLPADATYESGTYIQYPTGLSLESSPFTLELPPSVRGGMSWQIDPRWLAAFDIGATFWSWYDSEGFIMSGPLRSRAYALSLGTQYVPAPDELAPRYTQTISYRAGARFTQLPVTSAYELAFSLGFGLPLPAGGGLLDIVVEAGRRYDESYPGVTEDVIRIGFGVNGGRKWARSPQSTY